MSALAISSWSKIADAIVVDAADRQALATALPAWDKRYAMGGNESWLTADASMR